MKYIAIIFLLFLSQISYSQESTTYASDTPSKNDSLVSVFVSINKKDWLSALKVVGFHLRYNDKNSKLLWQKDYAILDEDNNRYLVKVDVPEAVRANTFEVWCEARVSRKPSSGPAVINNKRYGGVTLSSIKLNIASKPQGAETFLIPNRIWNKTFAGKKLEKMTEQLANYRVNPTFTNTHVFIDETVYAVVCKIGSKFSMIRHNTMPMSVSKEQNVIVPFEQ